MEILMDRAKWKEIEKDPRAWYEYLDPGWESHFVRLRTGVRICYLEMGPRHGWNIILLHGNLDSRLCWARVAPILANLGFHVIVPEQRGMGLSERRISPKGYWDFKDDLMEDVLALMDHLGIGKASFAGFSAGSFICQTMAMHHPERMYSMSLISSGTELTFRKDYEYHGEDFLANPDYLFYLMECSMDDPDMVAGQTKYLMQSGFQNHDIAYCAMQFSHPVNFDSSDKLKDVTFPVQIFYGEDDPLYTRQVEEKLVNAFEKAQVEYHSIPNGSHSFFLDSWENLQMMTTHLATHARNAQKSCRRIY